MSPKTMRDLLLIIAAALMLPTHCGARGSQSSSAKSTIYSYGFEFRDSSNVVFVRGDRWIRVFATEGVNSWGPGATVECLVSHGTCVVTQFYDGGATNTHTTYKVARWDGDRIEAENGNADIASRDLSEGYRQELAATCLILNRARQQVFTAQKQKGESCRQLDKYIDDGVSVRAERAEQLCALRDGDSTVYDCPNPPRPTDKHGKAAPTPTYHTSQRVAYCEDWVLNKDGEWEDHVHKCSK
jgi:hypothetical protein